MSPRRREGRIYWRNQGKKRRAYADFRDFADVGGAQEALTAEGERYATTDPDLALELATKRLKALKRLRRLRSPIALGRFADEHLRMKARQGLAERHVKNRQHQLEVAVGYFGSETPIPSIRVSDVREYLDWLRGQKSAVGKPYSPATLRHYLVALGDLFRSAQEAEIIEVNPVSILRDKPKIPRREARWLEVHDAALLLEAARLHGHKLTELPIYEILATFLLTGGRKSEVLGLLVEDVSLDRETVRFRPNEHRGLKSSTALRTVRLWPQLAEILEPYIGDREDGLLFPSPRGGGMVSGLRTALDRLSKRVKIDPPVRTKMIRHGYASARLQTLDRGRPVADWTVQKELGHGGPALVRRVYGHLGQVRHRGDVVEYRVEDFQDVPGVVERLEALRNLSTEDGS